MLIIYRKSDGVVIDNQGKMDNFPLGLPNPEPLLKFLADKNGERVEDYGVFRLHDENDKINVEKTYTHEYTIQGGEIVFGAKKPVIEPPQPEPTPIEVLQNENKLLKLQMKSISSRNDFLEEVIVEMAMTVYP